MSKQSGTINIRILFILIQIILYVSFLFIDLTGGSVSLSSNIKFTVIVLCFCYALFSKGNDKSISLCLKAAMLFTLISDLLILMLDYYFYGVLTFIIVQQLYSLYLGLKKQQKKEKIQNNKSTVWKPFIANYVFWLMIQGLLAFAVCYILKHTGAEITGLPAASAFYFICILTNTIRADRAAVVDPKDKNSVLFAIGMTLFLLCDINVGLYNLSGFVSMPNEVSAVIDTFSSILMWTFYAPAQVLIVLSIYTKNKEKFM